MVMVCAICWIDLTAIVNIKCPYGEHELCQSCFMSLIQDQHINNQDEIIASKGAIYCPFKDIHVPFSDLEVAHNFPSIFEKYLEYKNKAVEEHFSRKIEEEYKLRMEGEINSLRQMDDKTRMIRSAVQHIRENILNLKCPTCNKVFIDFTGCMSLECSHCHYKFCGWCFLAGPDMHQHVLDCSEKFSGIRDYFITFKYFNYFHDTRRADEIYIYLISLPEDIQREVIVICAKEIEDIKQATNKQPPRVQSKKREEARERLNRGVERIAMEGIDAGGEDMARLEERLRLARDEEQIAMEAERAARERGEEAERVMEVIRIAREEADRIAREAERGAREFEERVAQREAERERLIREHQERIAARARAAPPIVVRPAFRAALPAETKMFKHPKLKGGIVMADFNTNEVNDFFVLNVLTPAQLLEVVKAKQTADKIKF